MAAKDSEDDKAPLVPKVSGPDVITYTYDGSVKTKIERGKSWGAQTSTDVRDGYRFSRL